MNKKPELLAPAGNMESVIAAINGGADAIYFGGKSFNARQGAKNLSEEEMLEIRELTRYYGVKIYIVFNTLIKDSEWEAVTEQLEFYKKLGVDALIVQDLGLIDRLLVEYPEFDLQTSTQASVYGLEGVLFFEELGFKRVVLPREMPISQVAYVKKNCQTELKIFIHGALCYAYSGQCLMSSMIGGRSGNRGRCAQPCRKKYRLLSQDGQKQSEGYLISPKDLNTLDDLEDIVDSGVDSLKIEGRMKTPEYVYGITRAYRRRLDQLNNPDDDIETVDEREVMQVFNRDFTKGHLMGDQKILNTIVGKNRGIRIGSVGRVKRNSKSKGYYQLPISLESGVSLSVGDGLSFGDSGESGTRVDRIFNGKGQSLEKGTGNIFIPVKGDFLAGTPVYRNFDARLMKRLKNEALKDLLIPDQEIGMEITIRKEKQPVVRVFNQQNSLTYRGNFIPQPAQNNPLTKELIETQINRLGGSGYKLLECRIECDEELFLSKSQLNQLRKESLEAFEQNKKDISSKKSSHEVISFKKTEIKKAKLSIQFETVPEENFLEDLFKDCPTQTPIELVWPLELNKDAQALFEQAHKWRKKGIQVRFSLPQIMNRDNLEKLRDLRDNNVFEKDCPDGLLLSNFEAFYLLKKQGIDLQAESNFNLFNAYTANALKKWGMNSAVCSLELNREEIAVIGKEAILPLVLPVYGTQKVMISRKCLFNCPDCKGSERCRKIKKGIIEDERGFGFPVRRDQQGLNHVYNSNCLLLEEEILNFPGVETFRIRHFDETSDELREVLWYYMNLLNDKKEARLVSDKKWTRGSFKRGVK